MLVTGSCHATDTLRCPGCGTLIALDTNQCTKCGVRILAIRKRRRKNHRTEKVPSGDSVNQKTSATVLISGLSTMLFAHMSVNVACCSSVAPIDAISTAA